MDSNLQKEILAQMINPPKTLELGKPDKDPLTFTIRRRPTTWLEKKMLALGILKPTESLPMPNISMKTAMVLRVLISGLDENLLKNDVPHDLVEQNRKKLSKIIAIALANAGGGYSRKVFNNICTYFKTEVLRFAFTIVLQQISLDDLVQGYQFLRHAEELKLRAQVNALLDSPNTKNPTL